jgi:hypothetical protein
MTSLISQTKQIPANAGYYITVGDATARVYANIGTDSAPVMNNPIMASTLSTSKVYSLVNVAGGVFKDMGKTLVSSGRVFRKVQVVAATGAALDSGSPLGTAGVGGLDVATTNYITGFIELPGQHGSGGYSAPTPVARLG